jgi:hypothetical protein
MQSIIKLSHTLCSLFVLTAAMGCSDADSSAAESGLDTAALNARSCKYTAPVAQEGTTVLATAAFTERTATGSAGQPYVISLVSSTTVNRVGPPSINYFIRKTGGSCVGDVLLGTGSIPDRGGAHFIATVPRQGEVARGAMKGFVLLQTSPLANGEGQSRVIAVDFENGNL